LRSGWQDMRLLDVVLAAATSVRFHQCSSFSVILLPAIHGACFFVRAFYSKICNSNATFSQVFLLLSAGLLIAHRVADSLAQDVAGYVILNGRNMGQGSCGDVVVRCPCS
jgi:hypothetical protein